MEKDELPCLPKVSFLSKWKRGRGLTQACLTALIHGVRMSPLASEKWHRKRQSWSKVRNYKVKNCLPFTRRKERAVG